MGRRVMEGYAGMALQPLPRRFVFVDVEIVEDHVQLLFRKGGDHISEKPQEVHRSAALFYVCDDFAAGNF